MKYLVVLFVRVIHWRTLVLTSFELKFIGVDSVLKSIGFDQESSEVAWRVLLVGSVTNVTLEVSHSYYI